MKKLLLCLLILLLPLSACSSEEKTPDGTTAVAYYTTLRSETWGDWLVEEPTDIPLDQDPAELASALVQVMAVPKNPAYASLLDENVRLEAALLEGETLELHFGDGLRRMSDVRQLMLCTALSRAASQCSGVSRVLVRDRGGLVRIEMAVGNTVTDPETLGVHGTDITLFLNRPQGTVLEQVKRTVYTDREELSMEQSLDLLFSLHGTTGLHAPFDGMVSGYSVDSSDGICRIDLQLNVSVGALKFEALDIYGLVNSMAGVEGESRFLISVNGAAPSAWGIADCDGILFYNTEYIG